MTGKRRVILGTVAVLAIMTVAAYVGLGLLLAHTGGPVR